MVGPTAGLETAEYAPRGAAMGILGKGQTPEKRAKFREPANGQDAMRKFYGFTKGRRGRILPSQPKLQGKTRITSGEVRSDPNRETQAAMEAAERGEVTRASSVAEMMAELNADDES